MQAHSIIATRIHFVFLFKFKFCNPRREQRTIALTSIKKNWILLVICVTCIYTADERLNRRKDSSVSTQPDCLRKKCICMLLMLRIYSYLFILHGYIMNSEHDQLLAGLIAQLVEHCAGIAEVMGSNPVQA